ncbi:pilus assembly FimT family protein [Nostoc parmelioides]|uniref:Type II secretion system protein n=1 Tax=Nostoc parmelioides FACHB-3921 TaxID=2692909 RepID=A0ABR8BJ39_9NOSO|nr:type II secretion system protein [Nostoc parmelioides]MBD2254128.1 type II secretion system protein [Nostoc parmelioides FACHB-3921]
MNKILWNSFNLHKKNSTSKSLSLLKSHIFIVAQPEAGFSMVELLAVVMMIGILAVMALPSWTAFVNRQRVNKANDAVLAGLQEAQRQAKRQKMSYSVSFKVESQIPKIVVHPDSEAASSISDNPRKRWQNLGEDLDILSVGQIRLLTNLTSKNKVSTTVNASSTYLNTPQTITFDYMGSLTNLEFNSAPANGSTATPEIKVVVANNNIRRCVIVKTLLGATLTDKDSKCN